MRRIYMHKVDGTLCIISTIVSGYGNRLLEIILWEYENGLYYSWEILNKSSYVYIGRL